jgi:uncharacterized protein (TIGR02147 family)
MDLQSYLHNEYIKRCQKNPSYSLRAFAKALNLDNSTLSQIIRGKRKITRRMVIKVAEQLRLDPSTLEDILEAVSSNHAALKKYTELSLDNYKIMAEWFHYALFELVTIKNFKADPKIIARQLEITASQAHNALKRLFRVGLIETTSDGLIKQKSDYITTTGNNFTASAFRLLQKGIMERSLRALAEIPFEERDHTSMTMAINSRRLPEAKRRIKNFRRTLCADLQSETDRDSVYQLAVSFFPLAKA